MERHRSGWVNWGLVKAIMVLPGTVLVYVPAILLFIERDSIFDLRLRTPVDVWFWIAIIFAAIGLTFAIWTVGLFLKYGDGTPAPWDPPRKLIVLGPYRYTRNPMITGVLFLLLFEAIMLKSLMITVWTGIFFIMNMLYFIFFEEKGLEKRFGDEYLKYKANVPRWIPRTKPWIKE